MSFQGLGDYMFSHRNTLFGKVVEYDDHLMAWSLPVKSRFLSTFGYLQVSETLCVLRYRRFWYGCCR